MAKYIYLHIFILILLPSLSQAHSKDSLTATNLQFVENKGQWPEIVKFKSEISNGNLWIENDGLRFDLYNPDELKMFSHHNRLSNNKLTPPDKLQRHNYKLYFLNTNKNKRIVGNGQYKAYNNYFIGNDKSKWKGNVHKYREIEYQELYPGINMKIYQNENQLKWDFIIKPHADPRTITIDYQGIKKIKIRNNNLIIETSVNEIIELAPIAYQLNSAGKNEYIKCKYKLDGNTVSYIIANDYDKNKALIIDPTLVFASYTGSTADNWGFSATYDSHGNLYAAGIAFSSGYPTTLGAFDSTYNGAFDVSISKFDTSGANLIFSTYLGGSNGEVPASLIANSLDELFILGTTSSQNFPTSSNAYDQTYNGGNATNISSYINFANGSDLFITHLNSTGSQLIGSTYLGGSGNDGINASSVLVKNYGDDIRGEIMVDNNNNIYIVSSTNSSNFPTTPNVIQPNKDSVDDGIISKFDNSLQTLIWSTYFGGNADDAIYGIKVSKKQDIYIIGGTASNNIPTTINAYQTSYQGGTADGFIAKIDKLGQQIMSCSYIGSSFYDQSYLLDLDRYDNVYVFGQTLDTNNIFIFNALWNSPKDGQFITKLKPNLSARIWSTLWGNGVHGIDVVPSAFMTDLCNRVYLSAWGGAVNNTAWGFAGGNTNNLPISNNALQSTTDGSDYYLMVMADDASSLEYGSYFGGSTSHEHVDGGTSRFDNKGRIYQNVCAGCGGNSDFPTTTGSYSQTNNSNNCNNGVFKIDFNIPAIVADFIIPDVVCIPDTSFFVNTSYLTHPNNTQYKWDFGDGSISTLKSPFHIYNQSGVYNVKLIINDSQSCNLSDTITQQVVVLSGAVVNLPTVEICLGNSTQIGIMPLQDTSVHFIWSPASSLNNIHISNPHANPLNSTNYSCIMSNSQCADTLKQRVQILNLHADAGNDTTVCLNSILLTGKGNYSGLNYHWSHNSNFSDTLNNYPNDSTLNYIFNNPQYLYFKIDKSGCSDYDSIFIDQRITASFGTITPIKCNGDSNGAIQVNIGGSGLSPYTFNWNNGQTNNPATNLSAGYYSLTITDANGCKDYLDTLFNQPDSLKLMMHSLNIPCSLACIGKAYANATGGTSPFSWQWNDATSQQTNPATQLCAGNYQVTVTDSHGCTNIDTISIIDSSIYINFKAWADFDTIYNNNSSQLNSTFLGNSYIYTWTPGNSLSDPNIRNPIANPTSTTTYIVETHDIYGCSWTDTITIYVLDVICDEPYIYVPNAFTPNGDGKNDFLNVKSSVGYDLDFMIYDKWGELVFETHDINKSWDGKFKGENLEAGVYVYHLKLTCFNKNIFLKKGNITLIR